MKIKVGILMFVLAAGVLASCSKCYECTHQVDIEDANGNVISTETSDPEEYCTTDNSEISELENDGHTCSAS